MSRHAAANGNGHVELPFVPAGGVTVYRQPEARRPSALRLLGRLVLWALVGVLVVAAGLGGGAYLFFHQEVSHLSRHQSADVRQAVEAKVLAAPAAHRAAIALVIGYDHRSGPESGVPSRSDTMMLLRADPQTKTITMLSLPRDLSVPLYCPRGLIGRGRINGAYEACGSKGALETVKRLTGIKINYLITVDFNSFRQIVDKIGGVWIDVDRRYFNDNRNNLPGFTYPVIDLQPGYQKLDGPDALRFVRYRHTDNDLVRNVRQQMFVRAVKDQIARGFPVWKVPRITRIITNNVDIGQGGGGHPSEKTLFSYALFAYRLPNGHFFQGKIEGLVGQNELTTDQSNIDAAVHDFLVPDVEAPAKATAASLGRKLKKKALPPRDVSITVLNGTQQDGLAADTSLRLSQRGYQMFTPPNEIPADAPRSDYFKSVVLFNPSKPGARAAARKVANLFGGAELGPQRGRIKYLGNGAMVVVVVGDTFHGTLATAPVDRTPKREAPVVRRDDSVRETLRAYVRKVPFRLQAPTLVESSSNLSSLTPVRVYDLAGHKAVRLTFNRGLEYWGIQETDWTEAPVLASPTSTVKLRGRTYSFYYDGARLHMVVLHVGKTTYWVVNTLLDSLSNDTMLATAKSLRPVGK